MSMLPESKDLNEFIKHLQRLAIYNGWSIGQEMLGDLPEHIQSEMEMTGDFDLDDSHFEDDTAMLWVFRKDATTIAVSVEDGACYYYYDCLQIRADPLETYYRDSIPNAGCLMTCIIKDGSVRRRMTDVERTVHTDTIAFLNAANTRSCDGLKTIYDWDAFRVLSNFVKFNKA
jgi:hypothetical protein